MPWSDRLGARAAIRLRAGRVLKKHAVLLVCVLLVIEAMAALRYWRSASLEYPWHAAAVRLETGITRIATAVSGPEPARDRRQRAELLALLGDPELRRLRAMAASFPAAAQLAVIDRRWSEIAEAAAPGQADLAPIGAAAAALSRQLEQDLRLQEIELLLLQGITLLSALGLYVFGLRLTPDAQAVDDEALKRSADRLSPTPPLDHLPLGGLDLILDVNRLLDAAPAGEAVFQSILRQLVPAFGIRSCALHVLEDHLASAPGLSYTLSTSGTLQALFEFQPWAVRAAHITGFFEDDVDLELGEPARTVALSFIPLHEHGHHVGQLVFEAPKGFRLSEAQAKLAAVIARQISSAIGALNVAHDLRRVALFEERAAIARELHDSLAQSLSYMKIQTARLQTALSARKPVEEAEAVLADLRDGLNSGYRKLRELLTTFRVNLGPGGLQAGLEETVQEIRERSALAVSLDYRMGSCRLSSNEEVHVLHVVREALSNIVRHAEADRVVVTLEYDANRYLTVTVDDDGCGIEAPADRRYHHGMAIMEDRVHSLGGTLVLATRPGGGTRVRFRFTPSWSGSRDLLAEQEDSGVELKFPSQDIER
jgi:signal transduction histidine kinase